MSCAGAAATDNAALRALAAGPTGAAIAAQLADDLSDTNEDTVEDTYVFGPGSLSASAFDDCIDALPDPDWREELARYVFTREHVRTIVFPGEPRVTIHLEYWATHLAVVPITGELGGPCPIVGLPGFNARASFPQVKAVIAGAIEAAQARIALEDGDGTTQLTPHPAAARLIYRALVDLDALLATADDWVAHASYEAGSFCLTAACLTIVRRTFATVPPQVQLYMGMVQLLAEAQASLGY